MANLIFLVQLRVTYFLLLALLALGPIGCLNYGPISLKSERSKYNLAIQKTNDEQLLLNLVRLKYRDTPFFLEVGSVASQFKLKKIIKLKHAHNNTIYNNPLIYIILLDRSKKFFRIP